MMEDRVREGTTAGGQPMAEWARSETRDLTDAARQRTHEAKQETKDYAVEAKEYVHGAMQQTKEYVEGAREYLGDAVQQARDTMSEYGEGGIKKVRHDVAGYTREQPMTALLIAAGAGLVLGWLSAVGRR
jgi:ElaB/YqjD/DUF883 family membrane-anchored ribosome-binding protein